MYTEDYINKLVEFLKDKINIVKNDISKESLKNAYNKLLEIRKIEEEERKNSVLELELEMDKLLKL